MSSPSLYRRHRPRTFDDVVGQEAVVRTLRNAIERDSVHHAYLFVGSRGTGKTSMAKILAAALNCVNGPTTSPCGTCAACEAIASGTSLDVVEMDAASNNSVDDIRDLRDSVALAPMSGSHKVYILDEAHMLSAQAWNAFLKTLEEPPSNTVFVLATTEAHKILPTVADRCHRFDFQRPTAVEVEEVVTRVAATEGIEAPAEVLRTVARSADGSFRDALGTLEQLVTYAGADGAVSAEDALAVLGVVDTEERFRAVDAVVAADPAEAVRVAADIASSGRDLRRFLDDLETHGRTLLLVDLAGSVPPELSMGEDGDERLAAQATALGRGGIVQFLDLIAEAFSAIRDGSDARLRLELLLVKAAAGGAPIPATRAPAPAAAAAPVKPTPQAPAAPAAPAETPKAPETRASTPEPIASAGGAAAAALSAVPALAEEVAPEVAPESAPEPVAAGPLLPFEDLAAAWPAVINHVGAESAVLGAILAQAAPVALNETQLLIAFPQTAEFHRRKAQDVRHRQAVTGAFLAITGCRLEIEYELSASVEIPEAPGEQPLSTDEVADILVSEFGGVEVEPDEAGADSPEAPPAAEAGDPLIDGDPGPEA